MPDIRIKAVVVGLAAGLSPLFAAEQPTEVPWNRLCGYAQQRELQFTTTTSGEPVRGYCVAIDANAISVKTDDGRQIKVLKTTIAKLEMRRAEGHQVRALGKGFRKGLRTQVNWLLSPMAPAGVVAIPATLVWGAVSLPFCALGDLRSKSSGRREVKPI